VAKQIGFPVIIKATAGGGGKGMRIANDEEQFSQLFSLAQNEALSAFGNGDVYVEKYLARPRHVEIQILGDTHGRVIHLGERDCSVQRRHQKLIEESPSPALDDELRSAMGEAAVQLAAAINYVGAGTIEFLLDQDRQFLLHGDEHPDPGGAPRHRDGDRLRPGEGADPRRGGRADEHPAGGFLPAPRTRARMPGERGGSLPELPAEPGSHHSRTIRPGGPGVRVDTHIYAGYSVPPHYDSLLAKVIVHGRDRTEALARMGQALDSFILEGVTTTIPFLSRLIRNPEFVAGEIDTKFLERHPLLLRPPTHED
jgi:acetyl-CoA carboxylase biotin carboxylase subunit